MRTFSQIVTGAVCALFTVSAMAEATRHMEAHVHGQGQLNFAVEDKQVYLELDIPGFDILGFESISTDAQRAQHERALKALQAADLWFFNPEAGCRLAVAEVKDSHDAQHHDDHEEHHKHDAHHDHKETVHHGAEHHDKHHDDEKHRDDVGHHDEKHQGESHMDYSVTYIYQCDKVEKLNLLGTNLFDRFPYSEKLNYQGLTGTRPLAGQLTRGQPKVRLRHD